MPAQAATEAWSGPAGVKRYVGFSELKKCP